MRVLARAFGDQPLDREAVGSTPTVTFVAARSALSAADAESVGVGFPNQFVFHFHADLFDSLERAWEAHDVGRLASLWSTATPISEVSIT